MLNLIENLRSYHGDLKKYVNEIENTTCTAEAQVSIEKLRTAAEAHFQAEEACVYSRCLKKKDETLDALVRTGKRDHTNIKEIIWSMEIADVQDPDWEAKVRDLKAKIEDYSSREVWDLFPQLTKTFNERQMDKIRRAFVSHSQGRQYKDFSWVF